MKVTALIIMFLFCCSAFLQAQDQQATTQPTSTSARQAVEKVLIDFTELDDANKLITIDKWRIRLAGLSDNPVCRKISSFKLIDVDQTKQVFQDPKDANEPKFSKAMGLRIHFDKSYANDWAKFSTEFPLSYFYTTEGKGKVENVGPIKAVSLLACGRNFKNSIEVRMVDSEGKYVNINFGSLYFNGWRKMEWFNPNYIEDINKRDLVKLHLYPQEKPNLKFDSVVLYKSSAEYGGDFIVYLKDVKVNFEPYSLTGVGDIDDEKAWNIYQERADAVKKQEDTMNFLRFSGSSREPEYLETLKETQGK